MTKEEAEKLITFKNYCTCGGYRWQLNGRPESNPHYFWCPQKQEYDDWWRALHSDVKQTGKHKK
jgi:hypothetical protein